MFAYDKKYEIEPFGLQNMGATCYFNAMLQSLLSCTSFMGTIQINEKNSDYNKHPVTKNILEMMGHAKAGRNISHASMVLWKAMVKFLCRNRGVDIREFILGQQCAREGYHHLLDSLDSFREIQRLFLHRYKTMVWCAKCSDWVSTKECVYNLFEVQPDLKSETTEEFRSLIDVHVEKNKMNRFLELQRGYVTDFTCPKCKDKENKFNINMLVMAPEILVVLSKKYTTGQKLDVYTEFPETMTFNKNSCKPLVYSAVSQIEHSGALNGGHYWSISKRKGGWYMFNDTHVAPSRFKPTINTYMVFYHLKVE